jgi:hypothetical protein
MNCQKGKKRLVLFVGDELPEKKKRSIESHLKFCPECAADLEDLRRTREIVKKVAQIDHPDTLPANFPEKVTRSIQEDQKAVQHTREKPLFWLTQKHVKIAGVFALGILLLTVTVLRLLTPGKISSDRLLKEILSISDKGDPALVWNPDHIFFKAFDGPQRLENWEAPEESGVYAVMHKMDSENGASTFIFDYCGQGRNLSLYRGYPWIHHRIKRLIARTGTLDNVYVAVFLMPDSSKRERRQIEQALVKTFNPFFNRGV